MVLVWLFATFTSWANACLVQPSAEVASQRAPLDRSGTSTHPGGDHHVTPDARGADDSHPSQAPCASFCETEQRIVAKPQASKGDTGSDTVLPSPVGSEGWPVLAPGRKASRWRRLAAPPPVGAPVFIAFLRLTR
jgi:hypothetical protein